jgi:hypothetical protein
MKKESYFCGGDLYFKVLKMKKNNFALSGTKPRPSTFQVLYSPQYAV